MKTDLHTSKHANEEKTEFASKGKLYSSWIKYAQIQKDIKQIQHSES